MHTLQQQKLYENLEKFSFGMDKVHYLGYIIDHHGVHLDIAKIQVICDWPAPTTLTELRGFLGLTNFYRRFMLGFSHIAWALNQVTRVAVRKNLCGACPNKKLSMTRRSVCSHPWYFHYQTFNIPLRSIQMLQTMLWALFSLNTVTPWHIVVRHYQMYVITLLTTKKFTPLSNPAASGDITFLGRRQPSTLITSHYNSCRPKENCKMTAIRSGQHD
jgi:hypothetical protein